MFDKLLQNSGVNSQWTFIAGRGLEIRQFGSEYWPLHLNVHFRQILLANERRRYHIKVDIFFKNGTMLRDSA